jgi:DNA replication protein
MRQFSGFPIKMTFTPLPNLFFSNLLPDIKDITELKVTLYIIHIIYGKKGYPRFVTWDELLADKGLISAIKEEAKSVQGILTDALELAVKRGTILRLALTRNNSTEEVYFVNTDADRLTVEKIKNGELSLAGYKATGQELTENGDVIPPDIFTAYEQNIGMLTPMIADELREAEKLYPEEWIRDAFREAVELNKRSWRYIERILENWSTNGRGDGTYRRNTQTGPDNSGKKPGGQIFRS